MRGLSEVVAALALAVVGSLVGLALASFLAPKIAAMRSVGSDAVLVARINDTHAVCYSLVSIDVGRLRGMGLSVWVFEDVDGDGWNEAVPVVSGVIPPHSYYVVSPPVCG